MQSPPTTSPSSRSTFVTIVAWIFIVLAGFSTLVSIMQNVMLAVWFPPADMQVVANQMRDDPKAPAFAAFMFANMRLFVGGFLLVSLATLVSAIGLLKRLNWARLLFIGMMVFGIAWNLAGLVLQHYFMRSIFDFPDMMPPEMRAQHELFTTVLLIVAAGFAVGISALFGWIIVKLISPAVRREFGAG